MRGIKYTIKFYGETNLGMVRQNNEDTFICQPIWDDKHLLCAAIDGLGGYEGGEIAAKITSTTIIKHLEEFASDKNGQLLKAALIEANNEIIRQHNAQPKIAQMGCVASIGLIDLSQEVIYIAHVGDSRIYQLTNGQLKKLTHDHSLVGYREEIGEMTEEDAMHHPKRNVIDRYLGEQHLSFDTDGYIEISVFPISDNTQYLFCSDGLTDLVISSQIKDILISKLSIEDKVTRLITCANDAGGKDNITVVIADVTTNDTQGTKNEKCDEKAQVQTPINVKRRSKWIYMACLIAGIALGFDTGNFFYSYQNRKNINEVKTALIELENKSKELQIQIKALTDSISILNKPVSVETDTNS